MLYLVPLDFVAVLCNYLYLKLSVLSQEIGWKDPLMIHNNVEEIIFTKTRLKR